MIVLKYTFCILIAASSLFTSCIEQVEQKGIETLRDAKAEYLKNVGQLRLAEAEVQKAQAEYWKAQAKVEEANAAYRNAQAEGQKRRNEMQALRNEAQKMKNNADSLDLMKKAAEIKAQIDSINAAAEVAVEKAKEQLANAKEDLRVALAKIDVNKCKLTTEQATAVTSAITKYETALANYLAKEEALSKAIANLWDLQYNDKNEYYNAAEKYKKAIAFNEGEAAKYAKMKENVPKDADVEAWAEEVNTYEDLLEQYQYDAYKVATDAAKYKADVWHCGNKDYTAAFNAWVEESPFNNIAEVETFDPVNYAPTLNTNPADTLKLPEFEYNVNSDAIYVYTKYFQLLKSYNIVNPYSKIHTPFLTVKDEDGIKTVNVLAGQTLKGFVLGAEDATALTWKKKVGNDEYALKAQYGLKGALSTIKRDLVLLETEPDETIEENYNKAKKQWEEDRAILLAGLEEYEPYKKAADDTLAKWDALQEVKKKVGEGSQAMVKAINDLVEAWNKHAAAELSDADETGYFNAITAFAAAREQYLDYTPGKNDSNYFRYGYDMTDGYDSVAFKSLTLDGFRPKTGFARGLYALKKGKNDENFDAQYNVAFAHVVNQLFGDAMRGMIDKNPIQKFPPEKDKIADIINNKQDDKLKCEAFYGLYKLDVVNNKFVIKTFNGGEYTPVKLEEAKQDTTDAQAKLRKAIVDYKNVYKRFWGAEYPTSGKVEDEYNVNIYKLETFTDPYNVVVFDGKQILYSDALGAILASVDAERGYYGKAQDQDKLTDNGDWKDGDTKYIISSVIFGANDGTEDGMTDFGKYMYWKAQYDALTNFEAFQKAVEEIETWVAACEKAFEDQVTKAAEDGQEDYDTYKAAFDEKVAAYKELTGSDEMVDIYTSFEFPDPITGDVDGIDNIAGEWEMAEGSKMYEWAEAFLPNYPENLAEWKEIEENRTEQIEHLNIIIPALKNAYKAAKDVKDLEEQFKAAGVNTTSLSFAATTWWGNWDAYVKAYNDAKAEYLTVVTQKYDAAVENVETNKKALAKYEAGYDATLLDIEIAENTVIKAEREVADALAALKIAEDEYNKVMATCFPAE